MKTFDNRAFYKALNAAKGRRDMAWNKVATRAGVSPSSLATWVRPYEKPEDGLPERSLSLENVVLLMQWMNRLDMGDFLKEE